jgi:hypothetical protein
MFTHISRMHDGEWSSTWKFLGQISALINVNFFLIYHQLKLVARTPQRNTVKRGQTSKFRLCLPSDLQIRFLACHRNVVEICVVLEYRPMMCGYRPYGTTNRSRCQGLSWWVPDRLFWSPLSTISQKNIGLNFLEVSDYSSEFCST